MYTRAPKTSKIEGNATSNSKSWVEFKNSVDDSVEVGSPQQDTPQKETIPSESPEQVQNPWEKALEKIEKIKSVLIWVFFDWFFRLWKLKSRSQVRKSRKILDGWNSKIFMAKVQPTRLIIRVKYFTFILTWSTISSADTHYYVTNDHKLSIFMLSMICNIRYAAFDMLHMICSINHLKNEAFASFIINIHSFATKSLRNMDKTDILHPFAIFSTIVS